MTEPRIHSLKTWPEPFQALVDGRKTFELRKNDRGFMVGDQLQLREWDPATYDEIRKESVALRTSHIEAESYTDRVVWAVVTYVLHGGRFGLPEEYVVMGIRVTQMELPTGAEVEG